MKQAHKIQAAVLILLFSLMGCSSLQTTSSSDVDSLTASQESSKARRGPNGEIIGPDEAEALEASFKRSLAYLKRGNANKAQAMLEELSKSYDDQGVIFNALGVAYKKQGMMDKAVDAYKAAINLQKEFAEAHFNLGLTYRERGQFQEAEAEYKKAISIDPDFYPAHYNLAILYDLYMNRPAYALRHYKEYKRLGGKHKSLKIWIKDLDRRVRAQTAKSEK